jgi:hypothetical protein
MGLANNVEVKPIEDRAILEADADLLTADVVTRGTVTAATGTNGTPGEGLLVVTHNGALSLLTLRYRLATESVRAATASFKIGSDEFPAGSLIVPASAGARGEIEKLGLVATALSALPDVPTVDVDLPRIAVFTTWSNTEKVGWVRLAFDRFEIPFTLIHKDHVKQGSLRSKYDVIVMPHHGTSGRSIVYEQPTLSKPLPYRRSDRFKSCGYYTETDDVRGGMGLEGAAESRRSLTRVAC